MQPDERAHVQCDEDSEGGALEYMRVTNGVEHGDRPEPQDWGGEYCLIAQVRWAPGTVLSSTEMSIALAFWAAMVRTPRG
jgi:hypothetical protein